MEELLDRGAATEVSDPRGQTPLMLAAGHGHAEVVNLLLHRGAAVNAQDDQGRTALLKAIMARREDVVQILQEWGADPDIRDNGWTARSYALEHGSASLKALIGADKVSLSEDSEAQARAVRQAFIPLPDEQGGMGGCLVLHAGLKRLELLSSSRVKPPSSSDRLATTLGPSLAVIPVLATALQAGNLVQIVGTPYVLQGLASGAFTHMMTASGAILGPVQSAATGQIVGQLQFMPVAAAGLIAPLMIWQAGNIIFATMHLQKINERLQRIENALNRIETNLEIRTLARVVTAGEMLDEVSQKFACIGRFTPDMIVRLLDAERHIREASTEHELRFMHFHQAAQGALETPGTAGAQRVASLLEQGGDQIEDARLLSALFREQVRAQELSVMYEMQTTPQNLDNLFRRINEQMEQKRELMQDFSIFAELKEHAEECVEEMGWFRRTIWDRGTAKKAQAEAEKMDKRLRDMAPTGEHLARHPVYVLWKDGPKLEVRRIEETSSGTA